MNLTAHEYPFLRQATISDISQITALWQAVFGDEPEDIFQWLTKFAGIENVFVAVDSNQQIIAQLLGVPCQNGKNKGVYFYALATEPSMRGKGIMRKLMGYAEKYFSEQNKQFVCLVPASESLFSFYQKYGYNKTSKQYSYCLKTGESIVINKKDYPAPKMKEKSLTAENFLELRKKYVSVPYIFFAEEQTSVILKDFYSQKGVFLTNDSGYVSSVKTNADKKQIVVELFAKTQQDQKILLNGVSNEKKVIVTTASPLLFAEAHKVSERYMAMQKSLNPQYHLQDVYIRMVLEDFENIL